jgi:hypothetical protein
LVYSLQFSHLRTQAQSKASKSALSKDLSEILSFVDRYRASLTDEVFNAQEYSIKLIQVPKISNTKRGDAAIEFVRWDQVNEEDKAAYEQIAVIVKDKKIAVEAANVKRLKPSEVVAKVNEQFNGFNVTINLHCVLYALFKVRPPNGADDPFDTVAEYCLYDETHNDYVYEEKWVSFLVHFLQASGLTPHELRGKLRNHEYLQPEDYEI